MASEACAAAAAGAINETSWLDEARCGKLGFVVVTVNTVAVTIFAANLALYGTLLGAVSLGCAAVILPSIALFGPKEYLTYLPKPLQMGLGFAAAWASVKVDPETGIWEGKFAKYAHFYDGRLSVALQYFFGSEETATIADFGCGTGDYVNDLARVGFEVDGWDGNPDTYVIGGEYCHVKDLAVPFPDDNKYDWVMSLEVGEHLPKQHEQTFLDNVSKAAKKGIVLSWAKKGQGGLGHVNEQNNDYIEDQMLKRGWTRDFAAEEGLRLQTSPHCFWFRDTIMVYRPTQDLPLAVSDLP